MVDYPEEAAEAHEAAGAQRLKIVLFEEACAGGSGRHVADLACHLASKRHDMHLLYSRTHIDARFQEGLAAFHDLGGQSKPLSLRHNVHPSDIQVIAEVRRYLFDSGPFDVFHCHSTKAGFVGRIAGFGLKIPTVYTPHAFLTMSPVGDPISAKGARLLERGLAKATDVLICVSEEEIQHAEQLGVPREKLRLVPNGMPLGDAQRSNALRPAMRKQLGLSDDDICIGSVGRLVPQKATHVSVEAFGRAAEQLDHKIKMIVVGQGPLLGELETLARKYHVQDRVRFVGRRPGLETMAAFDIFAMSSCYEGHPYCYIEALSLGLPIVTTAVGGSKMSVINGKNGYVTPVGDIDAMGNSFIKLISSVTLRQQMSRASLELASEFALDKMLQQTGQVYDGMLQERGYLTQAAVAAG